MECHVPDVNQVVETQISRRAFLAGIAGAAGLLANGLNWQEASALDTPTQTGVASANAGKIVHSVRTNKKVVAFSFDDGPDFNTLDIADAFSDAKLEGLATFFQVGYLYKDKRFKNIPEQLLNRGFAIGNHTVNHPYIASAHLISDIAREIRPMQKLVRNTYGYTPKYFRPPGLTPGTAIQLAAKRENLPVVTTIGDIGDWRPKRLPPAALVENFDEQLQNGLVVLLHDGYGHKNTVKAVPDMIKIAQQRGFDIVGLDALFTYGKIR